MDGEFKSLGDLYNRVKPALTTKKSELKRSGINYIKEEDIWNCLKEVRWIKTTNLTLSEMVSDMLDCSIDTLDMYIKKQISKIERKANFDDIESLF
jgi:hypothetical protein